MASQVIVRDEGRAEIWSPRPAVILTRVEGRMVMDHATAVMEAIDAAIDAHPGRVIALHDWTAVESYEVAVQATMSAWALRVVRSMQRVVVGVVSPLVALAVRTANLAAGNRFEVVRDRAAFEAELRKVLDG